MLTPDKFYALAAVSALMVVYGLFMLLMYGICTQLGKIEYIRRHVRPDINNEKGGL